MGLNERLGCRAWNFILRVKIFCLLAEFDTSLVSKFLISARFSRNGSGSEFCPK